MLVIHENLVTDFNVILTTDNSSSLIETHFSSWSLNTTLSYPIPSSSLTSFAQGNVTSTWGPKRDPLYIVVPITVLYAIILLTGLLGNVSTCIVIARNKHMHTATNYYLFSLAVSDLLLLVSGLPQEMYYNWSRYPYVFGEAFCIIQGFAAETSANATVLTITAFTVERYVAICHPFQSHNLSKLSRAIRLILLIWILAMGLAVPQALQFGVLYEQLPDGRVLDDEHTVCAVKRVVIPHSFEVSSLVFFVAPMTLISVLYALIGLQLRRSSLRRGGGSVRLKTGVGGSELGYSQQYCPQNQAEDGRKNFAKNAQIKATKHVVKMLVAVVVAFFICWAPFHAQRLLAVYASGSPSPSMIIVYHALTYTSGVLYYLSTTVNPVLYHIMSHKFREAFKDTLARYLGRRRARGGRWQCYTVLSGRSSRHSNTSNPPSIASNCCNNTGSLRRYLEADMARLQGSRRPIVVSFRRHRTHIDSAPDTEVSCGSTSTGPEEYVSLEELPLNSNRFNTRKLSKLKKTRNKLNETYLNVLFRHSKSFRSIEDKPEKNGERKQNYSSNLTAKSDTSFIYLPKDEQKDTFPTPWCNGTENIISNNTQIQIQEDSQPMHKIQHTTSDNTHTLELPKAEKLYPKVEDIEIFQEQHLKIQSSFKKRHHTSRHNSRRTKIHKPPNASSSSIEYYIPESHEKSGTSNRYHPKHGGVDSENKAQFCNVRRSSTLPSFQIIVNDCEESKLKDRRIQDIDNSVQSLKNPDVFQDNFVSLQGQKLGKKFKARLISQHSNDTSEGKNSKTSIDSDSFYINTASKSEPCMKDRNTDIQFNGESNSDRNYLEKTSLKVTSISRFNNEFAKLEGSSSKESDLNIKTQTRVTLTSKSLLEGESSSSKGSDLNIKTQTKVTSTSKSLLEGEGSGSKGSDLNIKTQTRVTSTSKSLLEGESIDHSTLRGGEAANNGTEREDSISKAPTNDVFINHCHKFDTDGSEVITRENVSKENASKREKNFVKYLPKQMTIYDFNVSIPCCNSRPKSCTDLTLDTHLSLKQECDVFSANVHPSVTICNLAL